MLNEKFIFSYTTGEWQSKEVLILVGLSLFALVLMAITTVFLFLGVIYEECFLILPYIIRQVR